MPTCLLLSAALAGAEPLIGGANFILDADVGMRHEANVGLAQLRRDKRNDEALVSGVSAGLAVPVGERNLATLTGDLRSVIWSQLGGLDRVTAGATTSFRTRFGLGPEAVWV